MIPQDVGSLGIKVYLDGNPTADSRTDENDGSLDDIPQQKLCVGNPPRDAPVLELSATARADLGLGCQAPSLNSQPPKIWVEGGTRP